MSYPKDILSTRVVVKPGIFAVLPEDGFNTSYKKLPSKYRGFT